MIEPDFSSMPSPSLTDAARPLSPDYSPKRVRMPEFRIFTRRRPPVAGHAQVGYDWASLQDPARRE